MSSGIWNIYGFPYEDEAIQVGDLTRVKARAHKSPSRLVLIVDDAEVMVSFSANWKKMFVSGEAWSSNAMSVGQSTKYYNRALARISDGSRRRSGASFGMNVITSTYNRHRLAKALSLTSKRVAKYLKKHADKTNSTAERR